jgi:hypothetical protein
MTTLAPGHLAVNPPPSSAPRPPDAAVRRALLEGRPPALQRPAPRVAKLSRSTAQDERSKGKPQEDRLETSTAGRGGGLGGGPRCSEATDSATSRTRGSIKSAPYPTRVLPQRFPRATIPKIMLARISPAQNRPQIGRQTIAPAAPAPAVEPGLPLTLSTASCPRLVARRSILFYLLISGEQKAAQISSQL